MSEKLFDPEQFGACLYDEMRRRDLSFRMLAEQTGVDKSTLHRVVHGEPPNVEHYLRITNWMEKGDMNKSTRGAAEGKGKAG